jgi:hypothetical protein
VLQSSGIHTVVQHSPGSRIATKPAPQSNGSHVTVLHAGSVLFPSAAASPAPAPERPVPVPVGTTQLPKNDDSATATAKRTNTEERPIEPFP